MTEEFALGDPVTVTLEGTIDRLRDDDGSYEVHVVSVSAGAFGGARWLRVPDALLSRRVVSPDVGDVLTKGSPEPPDGTSVVRGVGTSFPYTYARLHGLWYSASSSAYGCTWREVCGTESVRVTFVPDPS